MSDLGKELTRINEEDEPRDAKNEELEDFLSSISEAFIGEKGISERAKKLETIYAGDFRHRYSSIASYFFKIADKESGIDKISMVVGNMEMIYEYIKDEGRIDKEGVEFVKQIYKLLDHINLERLRLEDRMLFKGNLEKVQNGVKGVKELQKDTEELKVEVQNRVKGVKELQKDTEELKAEVLGARKEYITILGIFAAIVLAFVAGIAFSNSTLANMHLASPYRLVFVICLIGLFTLNILNYLFDFVKTIHFKGSGQAVPRYCGVWVFNALISGILIVDFMTWSCKNDVCVAWMLKLCLWWRGVICGVA